MTTPNLPPHVIEALAKMNKAETDLLLRFLRAMVSLRYSGRLLIVIIGGLFGAMILLSQAIDAAKKLLPLKFGS